MPNTELLKVTSEYSPAGDQPQAIEEIVKSFYFHWLGVGLEAVEAHRFYMHDRNTSIGF